MVEIWTTTMSILADKEEHGKDVTTSEQYQQKLKAYRT